MLLLKTDWSEKVVVEESTQRDYWCTGWLGLLLVTCHKVIFYLEGLVRAASSKKCHRTYTKYSDSDQPAHAQSIIRAFALHSYILYLVILLPESEGPDQTA